MKNKDKAALATSIIDLLSKERLKTKDVIAILTISLTDILLNIDVPVESVKNLFQYMLYNYYEQKESKDEYT